MASSGCSGPIFLVISLEVVGRDTGSTLVALVPVIYDASTRPMVLDIVYGENRTSSRCRFLSMPDLGDADGTLV